MLDEYSVQRVRRTWALARDNGDWDTFRSCFHPDATVRVLWYSGPVEGFIRETIESAAERKPGERSTRHWLGSDRVWLNGERAILETNAMVMNRGPFKGHLFDYTIYLRLYDRLEKRAGEWRILRMDAIYDKDRLDPVIPGSLPPGFFDGVPTSGAEAQMALTRWRMAQRGGKFPDDIPLGGMDSEMKLRTEAEAWLMSTPPSP